MRSLEGLDLSARRENARVDSCSHCGGTLPADATFCPSCGRRTDAPPARRARSRSTFSTPSRATSVSARRFSSSGRRPCCSCSGSSCATGPLVGASSRSWSPSASSRLPRRRAALAGHAIAQLGVSTADRVRDEAEASRSSRSRPGHGQAGTSRASARAVPAPAPARRQGPRARRLLLLGRRPRRRAEGGGEGARRADGLRTSASCSGRRGRARQTRKGRATVVATEVIKPGAAVEDAAAEDEPLPRDEAEGGRAEAEAGREEASGPLEVGAAAPGAGQRRGAVPANDVARAVDLDDVARLGAIPSRSSRV